jgi:GNAT superfamily N-acetyltransferase
MAPAEPRHVPAMAALLAEMDRFYGSANVEPLGQRIRQITDALFGEPPTAYALLASKDSQLVGLATYSFLWPAVGVTRSLYLKELYVATEHRRQGIGTRLMAAVFEIAEKGGCSRVEWTADRESADARQFYDRLGIRVNNSKLFYRREFTAEPPR